MADGHEERVLTELLRGIAADDVRGTPAMDLEGRLMERLDERELDREPRRGVVGVTRGVLLATAAAALLAIGIALTRSQPTVTRAAPSAGTVALERSATGPIAEPHGGMTAVRRSSPSRRRGQQPSRVEPVEQVAPVPRLEPVETPDATSQVADFIPLLTVPLAMEAPLASFQIVRVQMPRAALGRLAGPPRDIRRIDEPIQADLLLGEDGTARAIRIATDQSIYPWRTR